MCAKFITLFLYVLHCSAWTCFPVVNVLCAQPEPMKVIVCQITEKEPKDYPENPDFLARHQLYGTFHHDAVRITQHSDAPEVVDFQITAASRYQGMCGTVSVSNVNLSEWAPTVPLHLRGKSDYLTQVCLHNQMYSRLQVCYRKGEFAVGNNKEGNVLTRVEIAKNCLGWEKWEIVLYASVLNSKDDKIVYRGWFDFPMEIFKAIFEKRNTPLKFNDLEKGTIEWMEALPLKIVPMQHLRTVVGVEKTSPVKALNSTLYPKSGERFRKWGNIITPDTGRIRSMQDFLTDNTRFAKFTGIGMYSRSTPQRCELGRFASVAGNQVTVRKITSTNARKEEGLEIELVFSRANGGEKTRLVVGGFDPKALPTLPDSKANDGWQMPMGIGNHSFWQLAADLQKHSSLHSAYYAMLLDKDGNWLSSHEIGIDGPLIYRDLAQPDKKLHLWLLSYERHALVGHYVIEY